MNSGLISLGGHSPTSVQPNWQGQLEGWRELLAKCSDKASRKRVHALRVATLRLQAQAEYWLREQLVTDSRVRATRRWNKQAEKLRRALSSVRDADVYLQMLKGMRGPDAGAVGENCQSGHEFLRELDKLERRLKEKRASAEKKFRAAIADRRERLESAGRQLQENFADSNQPGGIDTATAIGELIGGLTVDAPNLNGDTLHEFRGRAKSARYLAELSATQDPAAKRQAGLLKRMQNAAGTWHDWEMLTVKAEYHLGSRKKNGLVQLLGTLAERSLAQALGECLHVTAQLNDHGVSKDGSRQVPTKKLPVRSVPSEFAKGEIHYA